MEPIQEIQYFHCGGCRCRRAESEFEVVKGLRRKTCLTCKNYRILKLCPHQKQKQKCIDCGGSSICEHNRIKSTCIDCGGSSICEHNRRKYQCKECDGLSFCEHKRRKDQCKDCKGSQICEHNRRKDQCKECGDEVDITIKTMLNCSKISDKKNNRYDQTNFIDFCFVKNLIDDCDDKCCYCNCELQYIIYQKNLATIERKDDSIGHVKGNCIIACKDCNNKRIKDIVVSDEI